MTLQRSYLQIEELQAVELVEDVMGQGSEAAAVHVEALELLKSAESSPLQPVKVRIVPQVQLLQVPHLTEGPCLNPRDVVGEQPQNLRTNGTVIVFLISINMENGLKHAEIFKSIGYVGRDMFLSSPVCTRSYLSSEAKRANSKLHDPVVLEEHTLRLIGHSDRDGGEVLRLAAHSHRRRVAHTVMRARRSRTWLA